MSAEQSAVKKPKAASVKGQEDAMAAPGRSAQARRRAAVILEVLAGALAPPEAAALVGVSTPRYYVMEARALDGLAAACEPQPMGRSRSAERELKALRRRYSRLEHECARYQALARAAHRTLGLSPAAPPEPEAGGRKRRQSIRALRAARRLKASLDDKPPGAAHDGPQPEGG